MRKRARAILAAAAIGVPLALAGSTAASASPSSCSWGPYGARGSYATCLYGGGDYQSWTQCSTWYGHWYINYGPWVSPNQLSTSSCSWGDTRHSYGIQF